MATESKVRTYILIVDDVFTALQNGTGQAPIGNILQATIVKDPAVLVAPFAWYATLVGKPNTTNQFYDTQSYRFTAAEVANFVNSRAGTSFNQLNVQDVRKGTDASFIEVTMA